ncbi:MAG: hypothetical protein U0989_07660, partial [Azonexus sp.]|nr:hypothetical protein [Azonexus sp.]
MLLVWVDREEESLADTVTKMKQHATSKNLFDPAKIAAALAAAPDTAVKDADNPASGDWDNA